MGLFDKKFDENESQSAESAENEAASTENNETNASAAAAANEGSQTSEPKLEWLEGFNKDMGTQFSTKNDFESLIGSTKRVQELEEKSKEFEGFGERELTYKQEIEKLQKSSLNPFGDILNSEGFTNFYRATELQKKLPDADKGLLQELVTKDLSKMGDVDLCIKKLMLDNNVDEVAARSYVYDELGVDEDNPSEISPKSQVKAKIRANEARKELTALKESVQMPVFKTAEASETELAAQRQARIQQAQPIKDQLSSYNKISLDVEGAKLDFTTEDNKEYIGQLFDGYFIDANQEVTKENLEAFTEMRDALILQKSFPNIVKAIVSDTSAKLKAEYDKKLNNTQPPNTSTNPEGGAKQFNFFNKVADE